MAHQYRIRWDCHFTASSRGLLQITGLTRLQPNTSATVRSHRQYISWNMGESTHYQGLAIDFSFGPAFHSCVPRKSSREV